MPTQRKPLRRTRSTQRERRKTWIKMLMLERRLTPKSIAEHLGISRTHLFRALYDKKHSLGRKNQAALVRVLGADIFATYLPPEQGQEDTHVESDRKAAL